MFKKSMPYVLYLVLSGIFVVLTCKYLHRQSREFYFWDSAGYENIVIALEKSWAEESKADFFRHIYHSFADEISYLFAIPLLPLRQIFGKTREGFLISLSLSYLWSFGILSSLVVCHIFSMRGFLNFMWISSWLLLSSWAWIPTLDGRPDLAGGTIFLFAFFLVFKQQSHSKSRAAYLRWFVIGGMLAVACLFRRQFLLGAVLFLMATFFNSLIRAFKIKKGLLPTSNELVFQMINPVLGFVGFLLVLFTIGWPFSKRYLLGFFEVQEHFASYLSAFERNPLILIKSSFSYFSLPVAVFLTLGSWIMMSRRGENSVRFIFLSLFALVWFLFWPYPQLNGHYAVNLLWLVPIGIASFFSFTQERGPDYIRVAFVIFFISLSSISLFGKKSDSIFLPASYTPRVRQDYDEVIKLANFLRESVGPEEKILVPASSGILNEGILKDADRHVKSPKHPLNIIGIQHMDSYKHIPIKELTEADWVVVTDPFQWHVSPKEQQCVATINNAFLEQWPISKDFRKEEYELTLNEGVRVHVFKRIQPSNEGVRAQTEQEMRKRILKKVG